MKIQYFVWCVVLFVVTTVIFIIYAQSRMIKRRKPFTPRLYITSLQIGRLGNQMFEYASLLGISAMNNYSHVPVFPASPCLTEVFEGVTYASQSSFISHLNISKVLEEEHFATFDPRTKSLPSSQSVELRGYFQSWKYFHAIRSVIRRDFTFKNTIIAQARTLLQEVTEIYKRSHNMKSNSNSSNNTANINTPNTTKVGIHVRRGDVAYNKDLKHPGVPYFRKVLRYFQEKYPDNVVLFVVVSDDLMWVDNHLASSLKDIQVAERASPEVHLAMLTLCDHMVMTYGTFGWWAGYLSGGEVIYYKDIYVRGSFYDIHTSRDDYYLPEWIGMGD